MSFIGADLGGHKESLVVRKPTREECQLARLAITRTAREEQWLDGELDLVLEMLLADCGDAA